MTAQNRAQKHTYSTGKYSLKRGFGRAFCFCANALEAYRQEVRGEDIDQRIALDGISRLNGSSSSQERSS